MRPEIGPLLPRLYIWEADIGLVGWWLDCGRPEHLEQADMGTGGNGSICGEALEDDKRDGPSGVTQRKARTGWPPDVQGGMRGSTWVEEDAIREKVGVESGDQSLPRQKETVRREEPVGLGCR